MTGFICINKKVGDTSAYCVNKVKYKLREKCGHMGTLDPLASGVLAVGVGHATRLFDILLNKEKKYIATFDFSFTTPSLDMETEPSAYSEIIPSREDIEKVLPEMIGEIMQIPPAYSAKFVDGKRSYKLARKGVEVELDAKKIFIKSIKILEKITNSAYKFEIICGGGTYIRSIVRDIAYKLGCCGTMTALVREKSGFFDIKNSVTVEEFANSEDVSKYFIPPEDVLDLPIIVLSERDGKRLLDGLYDEYDLLNGLYKVFCVDSFWGVGEISDKKLKMQAYVKD